MSCLKEIETLAKEYGCRLNELEISDEKHRILELTGEISGNVEDFFDDVLSTVEDTKASTRSYAETSRLSFISEGEAFEIKYSP